MVPKNRQCKYFIYNKLKYIDKSQGSADAIEEISRYTNILDAR
jgi:hypothetical protein